MVCAGNKGLLGLSEVQGPGPLQTSSSSTPLLRQTAPCPHPDVLVLAQMAAAPFSPCYTPQRCEKQHLESLASTSATTHCSSLSYSWWVGGLGGVRTEYSRFPVCVLVIPRGWCAQQQQLLAMQPVLRLSPHPRAPGTTSHELRIIHHVSFQPHNHRIIELPGLKRTTVIIWFQPPRYVQGRQPPDQAAQSHIHPGLECLQGWGIHSLLGQPVPVRHHPLSGKTVYCLPLVLERKEITFFFLSSLPSVTSLFALLL